MSIDANISHLNLLYCAHSFWLAGVLYRSSINQSIKTSLFSIIKSCANQRHFVVDYVKQWSHWQPKYVLWVLVRRSQWPCWSLAVKQRWHVVRSAHWLQLTHNQNQLLSVGAFPQTARMTRACVYKLNAIPIPQLLLLLLLLCCYVNPVWAAIVGQPCNSIIICRAQLGQATSQLFQQTGIDDKRHCLWLSTGTQVGVGVSPPLPAGIAMTLCNAETIQERLCCHQGTSKPGCQIVASATKWELTTEAEFQSFLHWLVMSIG